MDVVANVFARSIVDERKLISFGFSFDGGAFFYEAPLLDGAFLAKVAYSKDKGFSARVIDKSLGDDYLLLNVDSAHGEFHQKIRAELEALLLSIRASCTISRRYRNPQAERIVQAIKKEYNVDPEWLWSQEIDEPSVFRHAGSLKWFGIIMLVPYSKFGRNNDSLVNVLNVKLKPEEIRQLIGIEGYELAYHMNKKYWLSILLDETRNDKEILSSIRKSYSLTE